MNRKTSFFVGLFSGIIICLVGVICYRAVATPDGAPLNTASIALGPAAGLHLDMPADSVKNILGEPYRIVRETLGGADVDSWIYGNYPDGGYMLTFNNGRLCSMRKASLSYNPDRQ